MTRRALGLVTAALALALVGCSATQPVRVLTKGERRWIASVGGPMLPNHVVTKIIPYTNVGMMWGVRDNLTMSANAHLLAAAFGVAGMDVGVARRLHAQDGGAPEITGQAQLYGFAGSGGARIYPSLTATSSWAKGPRSLLYMGAAVTARPSGGIALVGTPLVGMQRDVSRRLTLQLESKWMAANIDMHRGLFEGENSVSGHGGLALQLGLQVRR